MEKPTVYRFELRTHLDDHWRLRFDGMALERTRDANGKDITVLTGEVRDQAALYGMVSLIQRLGFELIAFFEEPI